MALRNYSNTAQPTSLTADVSGDSGSTTISVLSTAGFPPTPFTIGVDRGTSVAEIMLVTAVASGTLTVNRGVDGTVAQAHSEGASVEHVSSASDFQVANAHINDTTRNDHPQYVRYAAGPASADLATYLPRALVASGPGAQTNIITQHVSLATISLPAVNFARIVEVHGGVYMNQISPESIVSAIIGLNGDTTNGASARSYSAYQAPTTYTPPYIMTLITRPTQFPIAAGATATFTLLASGSGPSGYTPAGGASLTAVAYTAIA